MSRMREEMKVVPRAAWVTAGCVYLGLVLILWFVAYRHEPGMGAWPEWLKVVFSAGVPLMMFLYVLFIGYVYGDARRRGMRHVMWTLLAILIPNAIGIILYFIVRYPLPRGCPKCGAAVSARFPFCPSCGTALAQTCPQCHRRLEPAWSHCAHCGASLQTANLRPPAPC
ncbi:MAG: zinc-ribbon domain-containing protein [Acidobacteria bacterium]|nr:zinc-ribbon domain-containing protein [Acidobacteriota bacterium]